MAPKRSSRAVIACSRFVTCTAKEGPSIEAMATLAVGGRACTVSQRRNRYAGNLRQRALTSETTSRKTNERTNLIVLMTLSPSIAAQTTQAA